MSLNKTLKNKLNNYRAYVEVTLDAISCGRT